MYSGQKLSNSLVRNYFYYTLLKKKQNGQGEGSCILPLLERNLV